MTAPNMRAAIVTVYGPASGQYASHLADECGGTAIPVSGFIRGSLKGFEPLIPVFIFSHEQTPLDQWPKAVARIYAGEGGAKVIAGNFNGRKAGQRLAGRLQ